MERGLGEREIVKGPERHCIGWSVRVDTAQQQPGEQREQQQHPRAPGKSLMGAPCLRRVAEAGQPLYPGRCR